MSDHTLSPLGMRRPWIVIGLVGGSVWHPPRRAGAQPRRRPRSGGASPRCSTTPCSPRSSPCSPTRSPPPSAARGRGHPGRLPAHRVGRAAPSSYTVRRQSARHVPGPVRDRRVAVLLFTIGLDDRRLRRGEQAGLVAAGTGQARSTSTPAEPRLRLGLPRPLPARSGLRLPHHLPGLLPDARRSAAPRPTCRTRSSSAPLSSPSSSSPRHWSAGGSPTGPAGGRCSSAPRRSSTGWRCSPSPLAGNFNGYLVGMAIGGLGFGLYMAVDLALVADVLPDTDNVAKDLGIFNIAGALPFTIAPAIAPSSWRSARTTTPSSSSSPGPAPSSAPRPSSGSGASAEPLEVPAVVGRDRHRSRATGWISGTGGLNGTEALCAPDHTRSAGGRPACRRPCRSSISPPSRPARPHGRASPRAWSWRGPRNGSATAASGTPSTTTWHRSRRRRPAC